MLKKKKKKKKKLAFTSWFRIRIQETLAEI